SPLHSPSPLSHSSAHSPHPHSFPTRRSSDLSGALAGLIAGLLFAVHPVHVEAVANVVGRGELMAALCTLLAVYGAVVRESVAWRSEEHTSELQSRSDLVCRLLLEKKKKRRMA